MATLLAVSPCFSVEVYMDHLTCFCWGLAPFAERFASRECAGTGGPTLSVMPMGSTRHLCRFTKTAMSSFSEIGPGIALPEMDLEPGRQGYMLCVEGSVTFTDPAGRAQHLQQHDAAELKGPLCLQPQAADKGAMLLLFEMQQTSDSRFFY